MSTTADSSRGRRACSCTGSPAAAMSSAAWLRRCRSTPTWTAASGGTSSHGSRARTRLRSTSIACAPRRAPCPSPIDRMTGSEISSTRRPKTGPRSPTPRRTVSSTTSGCSKALMRNHSSTLSARSPPPISPTGITGAPPRPDSPPRARRSGCWSCSSPTTSFESCRSTVSCAIWASIPPTRSWPVWPRASPSSRCRAATPMRRSRGRVASSPFTSMADGSGSGCPARRLARRIRRARSTPRSCRRE